MLQKTTRRRLLAGALLAVLPPCLTAAESRKARERRCRQIRARIAQVESRLRQAHSARTGRRHRQKIRELELERYRRCR
jgi:septal ring factor EnvC (AmiA/AmiB activator)